MHTKGPWKVSVEGDETFIVGDRYVCKMFDWTKSIYGAGSSYPEIDKKIREEAEASAHLIAAAPELLEACKSALNFIKSQYPVDHGQEQVGKAWGSLENAINKAEGKG